ncbi:hypothetical protein GCM10017784_28110 [Deinococcus indicus]|uniref:BTAD domain-containing putative transcriptional regulator n=1 Tax=Deinococcus indicus TaxID=223556 RepID=UPI0017492D18|nr:BTAD domain-containing putative transcriptional regulator [Deinococcus indicus]GHG32864.1 hypothetical protein GCM10017784_28110 [Deinococcus indicus]
MTGSLRVPSGSVLEALVAGAFEEGCRRHAALTSPAALDDLWAAQCLVQLGRRAEGLAVFLRLQAAGVGDAAPLAAVAYRFEGDLEAAREVLAEVDAWGLTGFGEAVAWRERGMLALTAGRLEEALVWTRRAWRTAVTESTAQLFLPGFAAALAMVLATLGQDHAAAQYAAQALPSASGAQRAPLLWILSACYARAGLFSEARQALEELDAVALGSPSAPLRAYHWGVLHAVQGNQAEAAAAFSQAAALARENGQLETEGFAALQLAALDSAAGRTDQGRVQVARARSRAGGARAAALCDLQAAALDVRAGEPGGVDALQRAVERLRELGLKRDEGEGRVLLADAFLRADELEAAERALHQAAECRATLGRNVTVAALIAERPRMREVIGARVARGAPGDLEELWQDLQRVEQARPAPLVLTTLGGYGLQLGEAPVRVNVGLRRALEVLSYLLLRGEATLEDLQTHVFDGSSPQAARDYLHVTRHALTRAVPGLQLPFDRARAVYRAKVQGRALQWDLAAVREALLDGSVQGLNRALGAYTGPFLPHSSSAWVAEVRSDLEWQLITAGERAARGLLLREACDEAAALLRRLLGLWPSEVALHELLIHAVRVSQGPSPANLEARRSREVLTRELGVQVALPDTHAER